jgi:hypothetical protein
MGDNDFTYRNKLKNTPKIDIHTEDSEYYGYTDTNSGKALDVDFTPTQMGPVNPTSVFRKHKKETQKMIRKRKPIKKCKCK